MWRAELLHRLADYASTLRDGLDACRTDEERRPWASALAFVGLLLAAINDDLPIGAIRTLVEEEDAKFPFDYLSPDEAKVAEEAWSVFRDSLAEARR
ncbi:MAG TPA: hypothetical protein VEI02_01395 [Planctomycetota bacterium]|nr:hypothetical protein [Planctomycetota bacterium]